MLVLSHSIGSDLHMWDPQDEAFVSGLRVIRYDLRGHGMSDVPPGPYSIADLGIDLVHLLDALEVERASLCGLSLGGVVTQWVAASHPERVERVVLVSTAARVATAGYWEQRAELARTEGMEAVRDVALPRFLSESFRRADPQTTERIGRTLASTPPRGYIACCAALGHADLQELVGSIRAPTLVIVGQEDVATPLSDAERLHEAITGSDLVVLEDASHLCNIEQPDRFNRAVLEFLGER